ncbi:MAG: hypothetical protein ACT4P9_08435 [Betaproteobacteria bacterium]
MRRIIAAVALCALAAGCADLKEDVRELRDLLRKLRGKEPAPPPPAPPVVVTPAPGEPAAAGLSLNASCTARDETGYAETLRLQLAGGAVAAFEARIDIPNRGSCSYRLAEFRQTRRAPYVELVANSGSACAVRVWQQGDRVTVAPTDCAEKCTRGAFEYAWPMDVRAPGGGCYH